MFRNTQIRSVSLRRRIALATAFALAGASAPVLAEVGNANAYDMSISLSILGLPALDVSGQAEANIVDATAPATDSDQVASFELGNAAVAHVSTGILLSEAEYQPGVSTTGAAAQTQVGNFNLSALGLLGANLLSLQADSIRSKSLVVGYCPQPTGPSLTGLLDDLLYGNGFDEGNLGTGGDGTPGTGPEDSVSLGNLQLSILGIDVPIPLNPPPNTSVDLNVLGIAGATLILNEQVIEGDGITSRSKMTNALRLNLNVIGTITGEVIIAHSFAKIDCAQ